MKGRDKLSYSNVTATLALFLALAGGTTAIALSGSNTVRSDDIVDNQVHGSDIGAGQVKSTDIGGNQVLSGDIAANQVTGGKVKADTLFATDIGSGAVGADEIGTGAVGADEIGDNTVGFQDIAPDSVGDSELAPVPAVRVSSGNLNFTNDVVGNFSFNNDSTGVNYDPLDMWVPTSPNVITVPRDGIYMATGEIEWPFDADIRWRIIEIGDGSENWQERAPGIALETEAGLQTIAGIFNLEAGDTIFMNGAQNNTDAGVHSASGVLAVTWIGPSPGPAD